MMSVRTQSIELLAEITRARRLVASTLAEALVQWEERPAAGEWSVREIAEHVLQNEYFFSGEIARVVSVAFTAPPVPALATPGAAVDALAEAGRLTRSVFDAVTDDDLALEWQAGMSLGDLLRAYAAHTGEHLAQIEAIRGTLAVAS